MFKVCMVTKMTPKSHYSRFLGAGFLRLDDVRVIFYASREEAREEESDLAIKYVWSQNILYPLQILKAVLIDRPDIVHVQHEINMFGGITTAVVFPVLLLLLRLVKVKSIVTVHAVVPVHLIDAQFADTFQFPRSLSMLLRFALSSIFRATCKLASGVIVHAEYCRLCLIDDYGGDGKKIFVNPIGIPEPVKGDLTSTERWGERLRGKRVILFFGYLTKRKGVEYLIRAFSQISSKHPEWILFIAGGIIPGTRDTSYVEEIQGMLPKDGSVILTMTTPLPMDQLRELYGIAEIIVLPYTYSISSSLALSFAIQFHKPVIATDIGVFQEEVRRDVEGLLVPPRDVDALRAALERLMEDKGLAEKLSAGMVRKAEELSWSAVARRTYQIYVKILGGVGVIDRADLEHRPPTSSLS